MAAKDIQFEHKAREAILAGVQKLARAVKTTLGPSGRNVIIEKPFGSPTVTKDGVTVAKEIELEDPQENLGAQMVKEVASQTATVAGDGTTTATVYAEAIFTEGLRNVANGANATQVQRGISLAVDAISDELYRMAKMVKTTMEIAQVGASSANQDQQIGKMIAEAMDKVGKNGVITIEESQSIETTVDLVEGLAFDKGFLSQHFITDAANQECVLENPYILIYDKKISSPMEFISVLEQVAEKERPVLIIAEVESDALATLVMSKVKGSLKSVAVKPPNFGDRRKDAVEDIAIATGATVISEEMGMLLKEATIEQLGRCRRVIVTKDSTTIIEGAGDPGKIKQRIDEIQTAMANGGASDFDFEKMQERLAKLAGGVAVIRVGSATEVGMKEKKDRVEDALHACRAAVEQGILPGGGVAVIRAAAKVLDKVSKKAQNEDQKIGIEIVRRAVDAPLQQIVENTGQVGSVVVNAIKEKIDDVNFGYNALTKEYGDLMAMGVIVPAKVERTALENAASVAGLMLTTEAVVTQKR